MGNAISKISRTTNERELKITREISSSWLKFIRYCEKIRFGELQKIQIQDGLPVSAEKSTEKIKFN
ncbi:MAG: hypothetical protein AAB019_08310 [Planctomycetota bacterium]